MNAVVNRRKLSGLMLNLLFLSLVALTLRLGATEATSGSFYIRADGSVVPPTAPISTLDNITYTLTAPLSGSLIIERDNIVLDGAGYSIQGEGSGNGTALSGRNNVTVKNTIIENFTTGIMLSSSSGCTVSGNNATNNNNGIVLSSSSGNTVSGNTVSGKYDTNNCYGIVLSSSSNNSLSGNNATNNVFGIWVDYSSNNSLSENNLTDNGAGIEFDFSSGCIVSGNTLTGNGDGIMVDYSSGNTLRGNIMAGNTANFGVYGNGSSDFVNDVDVSNTVDGKPIYYWVNMQNTSVPSDAGYVALVNCTGIRVQNLNLTRNRQGMLLAYTTNTTITQNNASNNYNAGIWLQSSSGNIISENNATNNIDGITLYLASDNNVIFRNRATNNNDTGIMLNYSSDNNNVSGNNASDNDNGILLNSGCTASGNNVTNNFGIGIEFGSSSGCIVSGNTLSGNGDGIMVDYSSGNTLRGNIMAGNTANFGVYGNGPSDFVNDVDVSNTVDGKPIYYWVNMQNTSVPSDAGYVALVNCTGITVQDLNLTRNGQGMLLTYTTNTTITQNNASNNYAGISLKSSSGNIISGNNATNNGDGIGLAYSSDDNTVFRNNVTGNGEGISFGSSTGIKVVGNSVVNNHVGVAVTGSNNTVCGNNLAGNSAGVQIFFSSGNTVSGNNVTNNGAGIELWSSSGDFIYHNNFINNSNQVTFTPGIKPNLEVWNDGYPSGGNYWSGYTGNDAHSGPNQNETGSDGIGDMPHVIDAINKDNYPLIGIFSELNATQEHCVQAISNSTISDFQFNGTALIFNVSGESGTEGFCRLCIPRALIQDNYTIFVNGTEARYTMLSPPNSTNNYLYFTYHNSTQEIVIILEFPSFLTLPLFMMATLPTIIVYRRKKSKNR